MKQSDCQHTCSDFHSAIEFLGRRWMGMILYTLMSGPKRYNEIHSSIDGISDRLLTERLNELVNAALINKNLIDCSNKKVEYELTASGHALKDVIVSIHRWVEVCELEHKSKEASS
ncbi:winged helix-turn-helix transcriptional regulator [Paenibacillus endoradicis]|uniref:winged helix-turn-helix transcriptional regulator n=1 Tax=Paenibacillus endoradicis TaxID=2972487 RepID=UPI002158DAF1|nr:helix-turn-helix domain-containing protein [Paenibacillus endoradicis]MCR8657466.1 helix-turn-helix transcriptional regulator [Paenibacillus endoradicis]